MVVDIALVGMLAPYARIGKQSVSSGVFGRLQHACAALPSRYLKFIVYMSIYQHLNLSFGIYMDLFWSVTIDCLMISTMRFVFTQCF